MDKSALGHDHIEKLQVHASQKDYSTGFGGKYGVQTDRIDKSAVSWDHKEKLVKHTSQKDYVTGFGGKFGVQSDRQDKSAVGWDHVEKVDKHESQKDYSKGFGGKFGVQSDRQDKSAVGWDHHEAPQKHESQTDHKIGFGGKFGVQTDRMDKSAVDFGDGPVAVGTKYSKVKPDIGSAKPSDMRAKFERMSSQEHNQVSTVKSSPVPRKNLQTKAAIFLPKPEEIVATDRVAPKQLDQSKLTFLNNSNQTNIKSESDKKPGQLDLSKVPQFMEEKPGSVKQISVAKEEIEQLKHQHEELKEEQVKEPPIGTYVEEIYENTRIVTNPANLDLIEQDEIFDTGVTAIALYDYQAGDEDEISFDPEDIITHVEMIDEGWWRGLCKGKYGLFPANYVQQQ